MGLYGKKFFVMKRYPLKRPFEVTKLFYQN